MLFYRVEFARSRFVEGLHTNRNRTDGQKCQIREGKMPSGEGRERDTRGSLNR